MSLPDSAARSDPRPPESFDLDAPWRIGHEPGSPDEWALETKSRMAESERWATGRRPQSDREWQLEYSFRQLDNTYRAQGRQQDLDSQQTLEAITQSLRSTNVRSWVLLAIVASIIVMPAVAMATGVAAQSFSQYVAPITGIAGTVLGYWFSQQGLGSPSDKKTLAETRTSDQPSFPAQELRN
jgi:lipopolysaccharide export LptBFGC system permease protein LptF